MKNEDVLQACLARQLRRVSHIVKLLKLRQRQDLAVRYLTDTLPKLVDTHATLRKLTIA